MTGQPLPGGPRRGQLVGLAPVHQLQPVLDPAPELIGLAQLAVLLLGDQPGEEQPIQRGDGTSLLQGRLLAGVEQLQGLDEELHPADAAGIRASRSSRARRAGAAEP